MQYIDTPYLQFVATTLGAAAALTLVVIAVFHIRQRKHLANSPLATIEALEFNPIRSPEIDPLIDATLQFWEIERELGKPAPNLTADEKIELESEAAALRPALEQNHLSYFDPTGQHYSPSPVMDVLPGGDNIAGPMLVITQSPAIIYGNKLIKKASVSLTPK